MTTPVEVSAIRDTDGALTAAARLPAGLGLFLPGLADFTPTG
jgi:hypothetical protein